MPKARGANVGNPAGYVRQMIREGMSGRAGLRRFREAGGSMRDSSWRALYSTVRDSMAHSARIGDLPGHRIPDMSSFTPWEAGKPGRYAYQVNVITRDVGTDDLIEHGWTVMSDRPISINKALAQAQQEAEEGAAAGHAYAGEVVVGATLTNLFRTVELTG